MTGTAFDLLPSTMQSINTQPLFVMKLEVKPIVVVGNRPGPFRRVGIVPGGRFESTRLSG
jgi:hypothetical protein